MKKIFLFLITIVTFFLLFFFNSSKNTSPYLQIVTDKVKDAGYSSKEIEAIATELENNGFSLETLKKLDDIQINAFGETYGPEALHADLISVVYDDSKLGYIKRQDFQKATGTPSINTGDKYSLPVYKSDGRTKIGFFYFSSTNEQ